MMRFSSNYSLVYERMVKLFNGALGKAAYDSRKVATDNKNLYLHE